MAECWYVVPAQFALRLSNQPDTGTDEEPLMLLIRPNGNTPPAARRKLPRRARQQSKQGG